MLISDCVSSKLGFIIKPWFTYVYGNFKRCKTRQKYILLAYDKLDSLYMCCLKALWISLKTKT